MMQMQSLARYAALVVGVLVIDLGIAGQIGFGGPWGVHRVEHAGLVAGEPHGQQPGHGLVVGVDDIDRADARGLFRLGRDGAGLALVRLLQLDLQLVLHLTHRGVVLVHLDLIGAAQVGHHRQPLVGHRREHALAQHDAGVRFPVGIVGVLEAFAVETRIKGQRRGLGRGEALAGASRIADHLARGRQFQRLEPRACPDGVGDAGVEGRAVKAGAIGRRRARQDRGVAAPVDHIGPAVADDAEAGKHRDLVLQRLERFQFRRDLIADAGLGRHPARPGRRIGEAEPPEIGAEPGRQLGAVGIGASVAIEEQVERRDADHDGRAAQHAAHQRASIETRAHRASPREGLGSRAAIRGAAARAPAGMTTLKNCGLEATCTSRSGSR